MRIGLLDIDGHNFPNLALMKLSAYHKSAGDNVEWVNHFNSYDIVYQSKVFTFTPDNGFVVNADRIIKGGTGYDPLICLPDHIDSMQPDYSIYPKYKSAYGFLTRGCPRNCSWCVVPRKEGKIKPCSDIDSILQGRESVILMDNNVLASDWGIRQIERIIELKVKVDFNQGLDARLIDRPMAKLLSRVKWLSPLRMSCDTTSMLKPIKKAIRYLREYDCKPQRYFIYVLVKDIPEAHRRVKLLDKWSLAPLHSLTLILPERIMSHTNKDVSQDGLTIKLRFGLFHGRNIPNKPPSFLNNAREPTRHDRLFWHYTTQI